MPEKLGIPPSGWTPALKVFSKPPKLNLLIMNFGESVIQLFQTWEFSYSPTVPQKPVSRHLPQACTFSKGWGIPFWFWKWLFLATKP